VIKDLQDALDLIGRESVPGKLKIEKKLKDLPIQDQERVAAMIRAADSLAKFWQGSRLQAVRAWLLLRVSDWLPFRTISFDPPINAKMILEGWVNELGNMPEATVRQQLRDKVTGRSTLLALAVAQNNSERQAWRPSAFTDPNDHAKNQDQPKFRYLVHAMRPTTWLGNTAAKDTAAAVAYNKKHLDAYISIDSGNNMDLNSAALYLQNPQVIEAELLSCSVIDENHRKLYENFSFGLILGCPSENICSAGTTDNATNNSQARGSRLALEPTPLHRLMEVDDFLNILLGSYQTPLPSPEKLLEQTSPTMHNEVLVLGSSGSNRVSVKGILIKVTSKGLLWQSFMDIDARYGLRSLMRSCAAELNVPIVPVHDDDPDCPASSFHFRQWLDMSIGA